MSALSFIPNPVIALRNFLNEKYLPPAAKIQAMAKKRGIASADVKTFKLKRKHSDYVIVGKTQKSEIMLKRLEKLCDEFFIPFFKGGSSSFDAPCLNIRSADASVFVGILAQWVSTAEDAAIMCADEKIVSTSTFCSQFRSGQHKSFFILCPEQSIHESHTTLLPVSRIEVNLWAEIPSYGKESVFESGSVNPYAKRIREHTLKDLTDFKRDITKLGSASPWASFPVDVVYTWVNDQDTEWLDLKAKHAGKPTSSNGRSNHHERFKNRDELKFSLRSLEMFAPFVRTIFIVTNGQMPSWLNADHPKIKVISHDQIYRDVSVLPTFNSSGIETQLHHIDGLSENFLYFNDDFFLGQLCSANDFFLPNGAIRYFPTEQRVFERDIDDESEEYIIADANAIKLLDREFGRYTREIMMHVPYPSSKSLLKKIEESFQPDFDLCAANRFRSKFDLRPIAFLQYHYGLQTRAAVPSSISHRYLALWKPTIAEQFNGVLKNRKYKTFCINDVGVLPEKAEATDSLVHEFLNRYYPFKSSFEI